MIDNFGTIRITGRCFSQTTNLNLFEIKAGRTQSNRLTLVFGRNGSGKTTLSNALRCKSQGVQPEDIIELELLDGENRPLHDQDAAFHMSCVFNERFIEENIRIGDDGLGAIVMLGDAGEISDQIEECTGKLDEINQEIDKLNSMLDKYKDSANEISAEYQEQKISEILKSDEGWADRKRKIAGQRSKSRVNDTAIGTISNFKKVNESVPTLLQKFQAQLNEYLVAKSQGGIQLPDVPSAPSVFHDYDEQVVWSVLAKKVDKPDLSEREKRILAVVKEKGMDFVSDSRKSFVEDRVGYCPYCFRKITGSEIDDIGKAISAVLSAEVETHYSELHAVEKDAGDFDLSPYRDAFPKETADCLEAFSKCSEIIKQYNSLLKKKHDRVFEPIIAPDLGMRSAIIGFREVLERLSAQVLDWNARVSGVDEAGGRLDSLNCEIARLEIDTYLKAKDVARNNENRLSGERDADQARVEELERKLVFLKRKLDNSEIALYRINTMLAMIFGTTERLKLIPSQIESRQYRLISRGAMVKPQDVSSGEKNAIALCYFFTKIGEGKTKGKEFADEMLLFIDDPISSFDHENKVGILSLIKCELRKALMGNARTKAVVMTHDFLSMKALVTGAKDIWKEMKETNKRISQAKTLELTVSGLEKWDEQQLSYDMLLRRAYSYCRNPTEKGREGMGNVARRIAEAFSTFEYGCGFEELSFGAKSQLRIMDPALREYFHDLQFKLVLNGESHLKDPVIGEGSLDTDEMFSNNGIDRAVKDVLCLIYVLNRDHVLFHLNDVSASEAFDSWISQIREYCGSQQVSPASSVVPGQLALETSHGIV